MSETLIVDGFFLTANVVMFAIIARIALEAWREKCIAVFAILIAIALLPIAGLTLYVINKLGL